MSKKKGKTPQPEAKKNNRQRPENGGIHLW